MSMGEQEFDDLDYALRQESKGDLPPSGETYDYNESCVIKRKNLGIFWKQPPTKLYDENFKFTVNGYKPLIDYLDTKDSGGKADKRSVHLPLLEERCMKKYSSDAPVVQYENSDIDRYIDKGEKIRTRIRQNDALGKSNVLRRTHSKWSMTSNLVQSTKESKVQKITKEKRAKSLPASSQGHVTTSPKVFGVSLDIAKNRVINKIQDNLETFKQKVNLKSLENRFEQALEKLDDSIERVQKIETLKKNSEMNATQLALEQANRLLEEHRIQRLRSINTLAQQIDASHGEYTPMVSSSAYQFPTYGYQLPPVYGPPLSAYSQYYAPLEPSLKLSYPKIPREDMVSDVQLRILNRAKELGGVSNEEIRIKNRARCLNKSTLKSTDFEDDKIMWPSQTKENIDSLIKNYSKSNYPDRRLRLDEYPLDTPSRRSCSQCSLEDEMVLEDYMKGQKRDETGETERLRNAKKRARIRTLLLTGD